MPQPNTAFPLYSLERDDLVGLNVYVLIDTKDDAIEDAVRGVYSSPMKAMTDSGIPKSEDWHFWGTGGFYWSEDGRWEIKVFSVDKGKFEAVVEVEGKPVSPWATSTSGVKANDMGKENRAQGKASWRGMHGYLKGRVWKCPTCPHPFEDHTPSGGCSGCEREQR